MKLTAEQIECIDQTLVKKGVKFDDLKMEVLDHIASQIEYEMATPKKRFQKHTIKFLKNGMKNSNLQELFFR